MNIFYMHMDQVVWVNYSMTFYVPNKGTSIDINGIKYNVTHVEHRVFEQKIIVTLAKSR